MIEFAVLLRRNQEDAFALFTEQISQWWPPTHRMTSDATSRITLSADGAFRERAGDGREMDLGRVRHWEPPVRIELDFYLGSGPDAPTDVSIVFTADPAGTRVTVRHRPTHASAALWDSRVARYESSWPSVLAALEHHANTI